MMSAGATGQTPGYEIIPITTDFWDTHEYGPQINNGGDVVFASNPWTNDGEIWLYRKASATLVQITNDNIHDENPDIADDGTIVWVRWIGPDVGNGPTPEIMMRAPDGMVTRITEDAAEDVNPAINNVGQIVWEKHGAAVCGNYTSDIHLYDAGQITAIPSASKSVANVNPRINDWGEIVWSEQDYCDPWFFLDFSSQVILYSDGQPQKLPLFRDYEPYATQPDINDAGTVIWIGLDTYPRVDLWDGQRTSRILWDYLSGGAARINELGEVVFIRLNEIPRSFDPWLYRNGMVEPLWPVSENTAGSTADINNAAEVAWSFERDIMLMCVPLTGDLNCDSTVDAFDIEPFVLALSDPNQYASQYPDCSSTWADINRDGAVDSFDVEPFVTMLIP